MKILLSDPRVDAVVLRDSGEPLVALPAFFGPARARVRAGLVDRLARAQTLLPREYGCASSRVTAPCPPPDS